jgi:hypothetical protein
LNTSRWITAPDALVTVRVRLTCIPMVGYSSRFLVPAGMLVVYWVVSTPGLRFVTIGSVNLTVRPVGTLKSENRTTPGEAYPRIRIGYAVSFRKDMVTTEPEPLWKTVASRPSG